MALGTMHMLWTHGLAQSSEKEEVWWFHNKQSKSGHTSCDQLWQEFFRAPSQWWDTRNSKVGSACPDFKHKATKESLWIGARNNPSWVHEELSRRGLLATPHAQLFERHEKIIHSKGPPRKDARAAFVALLRTCAKNKDLNRGIQIHDDISKNGLLEKCTDALVTMYAKCGALAKARALLDTHKSRDVFCWTALITEYCRQGQGHDALNCFECMRRDDLSPDAVTFACILKACGSIGAIDKGEQIHVEIASRGLLENDIVLGNVLVDMYAKCGALAKAQQVLEELHSRDVVSWNALIVGYVQQGQSEQALNCFERMQQEDLSPNAGTFACILQACGNIGEIHKGEEIHDEIARQGLLGNDIVLGTALVDMYAKCGALAKARQVLEELSFRDVVCWSALIAGYAQQGQGKQALFCFEQMKREGLSPNAATFACILKACGSIGAVDEGEWIHDEVTRQGLLVNNFVLGIALLDMYAKCGALAKAQKVFDELPSRDVISWTALITGYAQQGQGEQALKCFERMQQEGFSPNAVTFVSILQACGSIGAIDKGEDIHDEIARQGLLENDIVLGNALVDMYAKCGVLAKAQQVLEGLPSRNIFSWNTLITGFAQQGQREQVLNCFERMQSEGVSPDGVTFSCVLNACSHLGLLEDGHRYFVEMTSKYGMKPHSEHYTCIVDLFGRAGHLDKAVGVIQEMPSSNHSAVWSALLGACKQWGDVNIGRWAFEHAVQVDKSEVAAYVLMASIYAAAGMQKDAESIEALRIEKKAWTKRAGSV